MPRRSIRLCQWIVCALVAVASAATLAQSVDYDIVYVRALRYGDDTFAKMPEVFHPHYTEPGADLMLLHPDGTEEVLFAAGKGAVMDPAVSFDAQWIYFSYIPDVNDNNYQRDFTAKGGADIYKINLKSRQLIRLTRQEWTPPTGAAKWSSNPLAATPQGDAYLGYGIYNLAPTPVPGGKIVFTSSRDSYLPNKSFTFPNLRLYIMDEDGRNVEKIGHLNIGSALHPYVLKDGRVIFASYEGHAARDDRAWSLWSILPDGRFFEPQMGSFKPGLALHWQTQLSDGRIAVIAYYNLNNNGFGTLLAFNDKKDAAKPGFGSPIDTDPTNPLVRHGVWFFQPGHPSHLQPKYAQYRFSPPGLVNLSAFAHDEDNAASMLPDGSGFAGKVTQPSAAPGNDVLLVYSPGPANGLNRPTNKPWYDAGIYLLKGGVAVNDPRQMVKIKNDPRYNEQQPRAVVTYQRIYGIAEPAKHAFVPNEGSAGGKLPKGTPFGLVGTSSFYNRNTEPGVANTRGNYGKLDVFNTAENDANPNFANQGADVGKYSNSDIHAVRILLMEGVAHRSYANRFGFAFRAHQNAERLRILGEIPLTKRDAGGNIKLDETNQRDTSFLAKIPADTPFTFQTLDRNGMVLNYSQTWHQVRPGESRTDCGGCHAHANTAQDFSKTAAAQPDYVVPDLTKTTPILTKDASGNTIVKNHSGRVLDVEYYKDIKPILQRSCVSCHSKNNPNTPNGLVLDDDAIVNGVENTWNRLADDNEAKYGIKPVINGGTWRGMNASRYIRMFQARRSLLIWKIFGQRLDGWTNADHPTESAPGNAATLPAGASANDADIDFTGTQMPPPNSAVPALTEDEKMTFARWVDLGAPIDLAGGEKRVGGWFDDELKPTLTVQSPASGALAGPITELRFGAFDATSGLDRAGLSVTADFAVNGRAAGTELASLFTENDHVWSVNLTTPLTAPFAGRITFKAKDVQGNQQIVVRSFTLGNVPAENLLSDTDGGRRLFVQQAYRDIMGREGSLAEVEALVDQLNRGSKTRADVSAELIAAPAQADVSGPIIRLYSAYFLRMPDQGGLEFWMEQYGSRAWSFFGVSDFFAISPEFQQRYGALNNAQFVDLVYRNVLLRAPDPTGNTFWVTQLNSGGYTRGSLMAAFSESPENKQLKDAEVKVIATFSALLRRPPVANELASWVGRIKSGTPLNALTGEIIGGTEYRARFSL